MFPILWRIAAIVVLVPFWFIPLFNIAVLLVQAVLFVGIVARVWRRNTRADAAS